MERSLELVSACPSWLIVTSDFLGAHSLAVDAVKIAARPATKDSLKRASFDWFQQIFVGALSEGSKTAAKYFSGVGFVASGVRGLCAVVTRTRGG